MNKQNYRAFIIMYDRKSHSLFVNMEILKSISKEGKINETTFFH